MKKILKVTGIIFGSVALLTVLLWAFVPGLPVYILIKTTKDSEILNKTLIANPYTGTEIPADYRRISACGLTVSAPKEVEKFKDKFHIYSDQNGITVLFVDADNVSDSFIFVDTKDGYSNEDYDRGTCAIKMDKPENNYEMYNMILNVTPADLRITKHGASRFLIDLMNSKETLWPSMGLEGYPFETEHGKGFLFLYAEPHDEMNSYAALVELFDKEHLNRQYSAIIKAPTKEEAMTIASTADVDPEFVPEEKNE